MKNQYIEHIMALTGGIVVEIINKYVFGPSLIFFLLLYNVIYFHIETSAFIMGLWEKFPHLEMVVSLFCSHPTLSGTWM